MLMFWLGVLVGVVGTVVVAAIAGLILVVKAWEES
jgi:hypothetical protein